VARRNIAIIDLTRNQSRVEILTNWSGFKKLALKS